MMNDEHQEIATAVAQLSGRLPHSMMLAVASAVVQHAGANRTAAREAILQCLPTPDFRDATAVFLDRWHSRAVNVGSDAVAVALITAAQAELRHQQEQGVEIVWTGPETADTRFRQTEQAVLEVINTATKRLTVVSYAVYRIPRIREALVAAANRLVSIRLIVETPNRIEGQGEYDCLRSLGDDVSKACAVYYWPQESRPKDNNGKYGSLHVKCAVADGHRMFLSSANLTEYAFSLNMELGLLITGGKLPAQVDRHFDKLIEANQLSKI